MKTCAYCNNPAYDLRTIKKWSSGVGMNGKDLADELGVSEDSFVCKDCATKAVKMFDPELLNNSKKQIRSNRVIGYQAHMFFPDIQGFFLRQRDFYDELDLLSKKYNADMMGDESQEYGNGFQLNRIFYLDDIDERTAFEKEYDAFVKKWGGDEQGSDDFWATDDYKEYDGDEPVTNSNKKIDVDSGETKVLVSSNLIKNGNSVSSNLPSALDEFLQDIAQMTEKISYDDIMKVTEDKVPSLKKLRRRWNEATEYDDEDEMEEVATEVSKLIKNSFNYGQKVRVKDAGSYWTGKEGEVESVWEEDGNKLVVVDFGNDLKQYFDMNQVELISNSFEDGFWDGTEPEMEDHPFYDLMEDEAKAYYVECLWKDYNLTAGIKDFIKARIKRGFNEYEAHQEWKNIHMFTNSSRKNIKSEMDADQKLKEELIRHGYSEEEALQIIMQRSPDNNTDGGY